MSLLTDAERQTTGDDGAVASELTLKLANDLDHIDAVNTRFNTFAHGHGVPDAVRRTFDIAFDELLNNIISYGYDDDDAHVIDVDIALCGRRLEASISDDGVAFDPFARPAPDTEAALDERAIGGLGIHLVKNMMDDATYARRDGRNVVVVIKTWDAAASTPHDQGDRG